MINLLPDSAKEAARAEYRRRLAVSSLVLFLTASFFVFLFLAPSYLLAYVKLASLEERRALFRKSIEEATAVKELALLEAELSVLRPKEAAPPVAALIEAVVKDKGPSVRLRQFSYERRGKTAKFDVSGSAATRASLIAFVDRLKKREEFEDVFSPVSNLVRDKDVEFTVQISLTPRP
ncbi:MAG: hypothetical protein Q8Q36_02725 [bacterium]|nr:hypothetical protein [bacterium]